MSGTKRRNTGRSAPGCRRNARRYRPAPRPVRPRPLPFGAPRRRSCRDDRAGKAPRRSLTDRLRHGRSCARRGRLRGRPARRWRSWQGSAARRSARRRGFSGSPRDHRYPASACPSAPRRTARSPPAPAERPPARRRRGHPERPRCSTARRRHGGSARCPPLPADARPATAGCAPPGAAALVSASFAVQRMQHRVGQLLGRDRLGEKIDAGGALWSRASASTSRP